MREIVEQVVIKCNVCHCVIDYTADPVNGYALTWNGGIALTVNISARVSTAENHICRPCLVKLTSEGLKLGLDREQS